MNILPQKRWNVYRRDNRLRVRRDEEQHRESQQRQRQQEERQRMSDVLILLKRKKAEAQARLQKRHSSITGDAKTQFKSIQPSTSMVNDGDHAAWLSSLVDFSGISRSSSTAGERIRRVAPAGAVAHRSVVNPYSRELIPAEMCAPTTRADQFSKFSSEGGIVTVLSTVAGASCWPPSSPQCTSVNAYSRTARTELSGEYMAPFTEEQPSVVRVRLPTTDNNGSASSSSLATVNSGVAHLECLSPAICFETEVECTESVAQAADQADTHPGEVHERNFSGESLEGSLLRQEERRARGEMRHVNFFEAEENEMRKLETKRKKYLRDAGYTPDATSEFEREIRASLHQVPWYYKPPSTSSAPKPSAGLSLQETQISSNSLLHQSQQTLQQQNSSNQAALAKQRRPATSAEAIAAQDQRLEQQQAHEAGSRSHVKGSIPAESRVLPAAEKPTVHVSVKQRRGRELRRGPIKSGEPPPTESEKSRRRKHDAKNKKRSNHCPKREGSEKTKRRKKGERTKIERKEAEDDVECLQVLLLVEDEDESSTTHSAAIGSTASPASPTEEKCGKTEQMGR